MKAKWFLFSDINIYTGKTLDSRGKIRKLTLAYSAMKTFVKLLSFANA